MTVINILVIFVLAVTVRLQSGKNFIVEETSGIIKFNDKEYSVVIPKDTVFSYEYELEKKEKQNSDIDKLFDSESQSSEFKVKENTNITLLSGTYLKFGNDSTYLTTRTSKNQKSQVDFYLTDKSFVKLKGNHEVKLTADTNVLIQQTNGWLSVPAMHLYLLGLSMIVYYPIKFNFPYLKRKFVELLRHFLKNKS